MNENQKDRMATIIAGLAASGHYTYLYQRDTKKTRDGKKIFEETPCIRPADHDSGVTDSFSWIINDALSILKELDETDYNGLVQ